MSMFLPPVGALESVSPGPADVVGGRSRQQDSVGAFSSVFLQGMLKEIFKNQWKNGILDDSINNSLYADMLTEEMIKQLAESDAFGLNELIKENMGKKSQQSVLEQRGL